MGDTFDALMVDGRDAAADAIEGVLDAVREWGGDEGMRRAAVAVGRARYAVARLRPLLAARGVKVPGRAYDYRIGRTLRAGSAYRAGVELGERMAAGE